MFQRIPALQQGIAPFTSPNLYMIGRRGRSTTFAESESGENGVLANRIAMLCQALHAGLLLAIVQVHFGYAFMQKIYWTQRRRYVLEIEREEDMSFSSWVTLTDASSAAEVVVSGQDDSGVVVACLSKVFTMEICLGP